jgi:hypothetical protein
MQSKKSQVKVSPPEILKVHGGEKESNKDMTKSQIFAALSARSYLTAHVLRDYSGTEKGVIQATDMAYELMLAGNEVVSGDLGRIERTLTSQFLTLDAIFANLAEQSKRQEYMKEMETYLRLALKAQAQARATAETLALLKNPMPFIKQTNIANGPQQVNNGDITAATPSHSGDSETAPNKLLDKLTV